MMGEILLRRGRRPTVSHLVATRKVSTPKNRETGQALRSGQAGIVNRRGGKCGQIVPGLLVRPLGYDGAFVGGGGIGSERSGDGDCPEAKGYEKCKPEFEREA